MVTQTSPNDSRPSSDLTELRHFTGPSRELWPRLAESLGQVARADRCLLALATGGDPRQWGRLHDWNRGPSRGPSHNAFNGLVQELAELAAQEGALVRSLSVPGAHAVAMRLPVSTSAETCVALLLLTGTSEALARGALDRLELVQDTVRLAQEYRQAREGAAAQQRLTEILEVLATVQDQAKFFPAALALCNGLADRFGAERVSLGWVRGPSIRLRAVSRTERIQRQMELAQAIEAVMEEGLDQETDLVYPTTGDGLVTHEHARFSREQASPNLATLLLHAGAEIPGAVLLERAAGPWDVGELQQVRVALDLLARRLHDLERFDRWLGARWVLWWRERLGQLVGHRHTWLKLLGIGLFVGLLLLVFLRPPYRVEGSFTVRAEQLAQLGVPFDGYIGQVLVRPGDRVTNNQPLLQLDLRDLVLEEASATAEVQRYQREAEKARAAGALGDMRVAEALVRQGEARQAQLRNRIEQTTIRSPFDGVVIEGDFTERLGQPVRQGDPLFRVARLERLFVEAEIPERDVHELAGTEGGEIAFLSQPGVKFAVTGRTLEPAAVTREAGNVFLYRCEFSAPPAAWVRPGMQGVAKINVGRRRLIWILTHRTADFLRLHLWW